MIRRGASLSVALLAAPALAEPCRVDLAAGPEAGGRSVLEEVFGKALPYPFEAVLAALEARAEVETALIPVGRSLQRDAAAPDFFASPRVVVAVTEDAPAPDAPALGARLFLGFQPAAQAVEVIAYTPASGRFEFLLVEDYGPGLPNAILPAAREVCATCHENGAAIFPRPLWSETNANRVVAERLSPLGEHFHGAPVRQDVDALGAFDAATDAAGRIALAQALWQGGCADAACRGELLLAALSWRLGGALPGWRWPERAGFAAACPEGFAGVSADLANRDPLLPGTAGTDVSDPLDPATPRAPERLWAPGPDGFARAAREVAALLAASDTAWIGTLGRDGAPEALTGRCRMGSGGATTFDCEGPGVLARGFLEAEGGRIERLEIAGAVLPRVALARSDNPASAAAPGPTRNGNSEASASGREKPRIEPRARDAGGSVAPRAVPGSRSRTGATLRPAAPLRLHDLREVATLAFDGDTLTVTLRDDLAPLRAALAREHPALGPGPFDRRAVLVLIADALERADG